MKRLFILITFSCLLFLQGSFAQVDLQAPLPQDPNIVTGKPPNGIVYYLRHNEEPKGRASFYIIRNAGALLENDEQDGLPTSWNTWPFREPRISLGKVSSPLWKSTEFLSAVTSMLTLHKMKRSTI